MTVAAAATAPSSAGQRSGTMRASAIARAERRQVRQRPVGLRPGVVGLHGPRDRCIRERRERGEQQQRHAAPRASGRTEHRDRRGERRADQHHADLDPGVGADVRPSGGQECDQQEACSEDCSNGGVDARARPTKAVGGIDVVRMRHGAIGRRGDWRHGREGISALLRPVGVKWPAHLSDRRAISISVWPNTAARGLDPSASSGCSDRCTTGGSRRHV